MLALTQRGRLDGALRLNVAGLEKFLPAIGGERRARRSVSTAWRPRSTRSTVRCRGLRSASRRRSSRRYRRDCSGCSASRSEIEGKRGVAVPVRFTDGAASFGPIPLGQVPPAF